MDDIIKTKGRIFMEGGGATGRATSLKTQAKSKNAGSRISDRRT